MKKLLIISLLIFVLTSCFNWKEQEKNLSWLSSPSQDKEAVIKKEDNKKTKKEVKKVEIEKITNEIKKLDKKELVKEKQENIMIWSWIFWKELQKFIDILMIDPDYIRIVDCNSFIMKETIDYCTEKQKEYLKIMSK